MFKMVCLLFAVVPAVAQPALKVSCTAAIAPFRGEVKYGFDLIAPPEAFDGGACSGAKTFFFSAAEGDGDYRVTLTLGGPRRSVTTVRAESRRLMVKQLALAAGASQTVTFNVHVRTKVIAGTNPAQEVRLKPREVGALDLGDDKLTLEFSGENPSVRSIAIEPAHVTVVYLAGDSTVVDQDKEPWAAWGQMLPAFFSARVSIANEAESGETIRSFVGERRYAKILSIIQPGDFLMVQFAHNDQKPGPGFVSVADYKDSLRQYVADARAHGATPILVTSMNRRSFDAEGHIQQTLGEYPQAMREVAAEQTVALIDLNALSKTLFEAMGEAGTLHAFVHYPANTFPDQPEELKDETHFNSYGAWELARVVVQSIRDQHLPLERFLKPGLAVFDAAKPDAWAGFTLPASPLVSTTTPYGR